VNEFKEKLRQETEKVKPKKRKKSALEILLDIKGDPPTDQDEGA
jgi:hypothetical protein